MIQVYTVNIMPRRRTKDTDMPARVYKHGRWYRFVPPPPGKPIKLGTTKPEALRKYAELMEKGEALTIDHLLDRYYAEVTPTKAKSTQYTDKSAVKVLKAWCGKVGIQELRRQHVFQFMDERGKQSPGNANKELSLLKMAYQRAIRWGYCEDNPASGVDLATVHPARRPYLPDGMMYGMRDICLQHGREYIAFAIELGYLTGLRRGDILGLKLSDVTSQGILTTISKSGKMGAPPKEALVEWNDHLRALVSRIKASCKAKGAFYLVHKGDGQRLSTTWFNNSWQYTMRKYIESGGQRWQFKDLRAKHATDVEEAGGDPTRNLTHSNPATTKRHYLLKPIKIRPL